MPILLSVLLLFPLQNYWGGVDPETDASQFPDVSFSTPTPASSSFTHNYICGTIPTKSEDRKNNEQALSLPVDFQQDCLELYYLGREYTQTPGERKKGYDTLKYFIYVCTPGNQFTTYIAFENMSTAIQYMGGSKDRYVEFREWLKSVLYLNTIDPKYYCKAVEAIVFTYSSDEYNKEDLRSQLAIVQYLLESGKCDMDRDVLIKAYDMRRQEQYKRWADTVTADTNVVKMDTTIPTLEDLDLEILRGQQNAVEYSWQPSLVEVKATTNPFTTSTEIEYTLGRTTQVELSLHNALGQTVWHRPFGKVEDAVQHRITLSGDDLQAGTYFLRVSTIEGEVKTVKD